MRIPAALGAVLALLILWLLSCDRPTESRPIARTKGQEPLVCTMTWSPFLQDSVRYCPDPKPRAPW